MLQFDYPRPQLVRPEWTYLKRRGACTLLVVRAGTADAFHARHRALLQVANETAMFSGFCSTRFADTFEKTNGLLTAERAPKTGLEQISAATRNAAH